MGSHAQSLGLARLTGWSFPRRDVRSAYYIWLSALRGSIALRLLPHIACVDCLLLYLQQPIILLERVELLIEDESSKRKLLFLCFYIMPPCWSAWCLMQRFAAVQHLKPLLFSICHVCEQRTVNVLTTAVNMSLVNLPYTDYMSKLNCSLLQMTEVSPWGLIRKYTRYSPRCFMYLVRLNL